MACPGNGPVPPCWVSDPLAVGKLPPRLAADGEERTGWQRTGSVEHGNTPRLVVT
jgi:hypothetical protein